MKKKVRLKILYKVLLFFILLVVGGIQLFLMLYEIDSSILKYKEKSDISYKVYVKPNEYFKEDYLEEGSTYIAPLIDYFELNYSYNNNFSEVVDYRGSYNVTADLVIYSSDNSSKPVMTKKYTLLDNNEFSGSDKSIYLNVDKQKIDYDEYNKIVQTLKKEITPSATLVINYNTRYTYKTNRMDEEETINSTSSLQIPISNRTINVDLTKSNLDNTNSIKQNSGISYFQVLFFMITVFLCLLDLVVIIYYLFKRIDDKDDYIKTKDKLLREYDRMITESKSRIEFNEDTTFIEIKSFEELIDVHDNLGLPIVFSEIKENNSCEFIIKNNNDVYRYVLRKKEN